MLLVQEVLVLLETNAAAQADLVPVHLIRHTHFLMTGHAPASDDKLLHDRGSTLIQGAPERMQQYQPTSYISERDHDVDTCSALAVPLAA